MANPYFNFTQPLSRNTLGRAEAVNALIQAIADGFDLVGEFGGSRSINEQTGTTYTLVLTDASKLLMFENAASVTLTIPANADVALPLGTQIDLGVMGTGGLLVVDPASGVTLNGATANITVTGQNAGATLVQRTLNNWWIVGALA